MVSSKDSNSSKKGEWIEFIPKRGGFDSKDSWSSPQKTFTILFDGTPELPMCQIGVKEPTKTQSVTLISASMTYMAQ